MMYKSLVVNIIKAIASAGSKRVLRSLILRNAYLRNAYVGRRYYCSVCNTHLWHFDSIPTWYLKTLDNYGFIYSIFALETLNLFACSCPSCGASDRDRLYALYFKQKFEKMDTTKEYTFIDFAPCVVSKAIKKYPFLVYWSSELVADNVDVKADLMESPYRDNSVDIFICSHILEHVEDDRKAMAELYRILKPGGWGIAMVPILLTLSDIYEDTSIKSEADRWKHFGQGDHLRMYSKQGFVGRLEDAGFKVNQLAIDYFGTDVFEKHGIHPRSVLYVVEKQ